MFVVSLVFYLGCLTVDGASYGLGCAENLTHCPRKVLRKRLDSEHPAHTCGHVLTVRGTVYLTENIVTSANELDTASDQVRQDCVVYAQ